MTHEQKKYTVTVHVTLSTVYEIEDMGPREAGMMAKRYARDATYPIDFEVEEVRVEDVEEGW